MYALSRLLLVLWCCLAGANLALAADEMLARIRALEPQIGAYPPNLPDEAAKREVTRRYEALKAELDSRLHAHPDDLDARYQRGYLQTLGHNFDYPQAWQGATDDLKAVLQQDEEHVPALLRLGQLWVNSSPQLAPRAEMLFRAAQCIQGAKPLEDAQRGLFFAFYYQAKMREAYLQGQYLTQTWPQNRQYPALYDMVRSVLGRSKTALPTGQQTNPTSCEP